MNRQRVFGIPYSIADALPGQDYPGEIFPFTDDYGRENFGSGTTTFPAINAGGRASGSVQRAMSAACHLFIDSIAVVLVRMRPTHFTPAGLFDSFLKKSDMGNLLEVQEIHYTCFEFSLHRNARNIRCSSGTPLHMRVYGYLYEFESGALQLVEKSCGNPKAARGVK